MCYDSVAPSHVVVDRQPHDSECAMKMLLLRRGGKQAASCQCMCNDNFAPSHVVVDRKPHDSVCAMIILLLPHGGRQEVS
ncbi:hypothetical protein DPMN_173178 [Dreissena polymorpha]|uniref:Uncharacterized protein n=1 Tax=Dreissena polymorpha TaxID=45954 RepID=A0A9D4E138_DREPO|nr:hypothetical protein DPMN_173178 [Dreissena polymorpha]